MTLQGILLLILSTGAAYMDCKGERVPNEWILLFWIGGLIFRVLSDHWMGPVYFLVGALFPILLLYLLFYFRMLGAGDIKVLSAIGGIAGVRMTNRILVCSFLIGAVLALAILFISGNFFPRLMYFTNYFKQLFQTKKYRPYYRKGFQVENMHFTVPILMSVLLYMGGII